jgi:hypothetical protein
MKTLLHGTGEVLMGIESELESFFVPEVGFKIFGIIFYEYPLIYK